MEKVIRDGKVAVLYSPGYGAGWFTWNREHPELLFDPGLVNLLSDGKKEEALTYAELKWGTSCYLGGLDQLKIEWIPEGMQFRINEYDGNETFIFQENEEWFVA